LRILGLEHFARHILRPSLLSLAFIAVLCAPLASGQTASSELTNNPLFHKQCAKCHGKTAEGRHFGGPSLVSGKSVSMSDEELRNMITNGKGRMPKYSGKLSPQEVDMLVRQIKRARKR
jgi:mono/diheme cytochrome c family protein